MWKLFHYQEVPAKTYQEVKRIVFRFLFIIVAIGTQVLNWKYNVKTTSPPQQMLHLKLICKVEISYTVFQKGLGIGLL